MFRNYDMDQEQHRAAIYSLIAMQTFAQFLAHAAQKGEVVNTLFEERLFDLVGVLHKITDALTAEHISHELIGGLPFSFMLRKRTRSTRL